MELKDFNMSQIRVVFWWTSACRSVMPLFRELAQIYEGEILVVVQEALGEYRRQFGWQPDDSGDIQVIILPENEEEHWQVAQKILLEEVNSLHVLGGYQRIALHQRIITLAQSMGIRYGIMSEAPMNMKQGWKAWLKNIYLKTLVPIKASRVAPKSQFFICLSGRRFKEVLDGGWPLDKIYPFGYFPEPKAVQSRQIVPAGEPLRILCMGALLQFKGVDILLTAVDIAKQLGAKCVVEIVGDGAERQRLQELATSLGIDQWVKFHGFISDSQLEQIISESDVLVCPGIEEPWGIRINEGMQSGLVVISSDRLGAGELISSSGAGILFRSGDAGELADIIGCLCQQPRLVQYYKHQAISFAPLIHPREAARHFIEILNHNLGSTLQRPTAPWHSLQNYQKQELKSSELIGSP
jgi:glycosyltransferase involved in cell wall biosynthesis